MPINTFNTGTARPVLDARAGVAAGPTRLWIAVLAAALAVRVALLVATFDMGPRIVDEQHYYELASNLVRTGSFSMGGAPATSLRPPLYPMFMAAIWRVAGAHNVAAVRVAQLALVALTLWLVYRVATQAFDRGTALLAALALACYPSLLFSGVLLLTETLFTALVAAFLYACVALMLRPSSPAALGAGVTLGAAALTRSVLWPFPLVLVPFLAFTLRVGGRERLKLCGLVLAGFALVVAPWSIRNSRLQRTLTIVDTMGGLNLLMGNYEFTPEDRMWDAVSIGGDRGWDAPLRRLPPPPGGWTEGLKDHWAERRAIAFMLAHPLTTARRSLLKLADFWGLEREWIAGVQQRLYEPPAWFAIVSGAAVLLVYPATLILAIAGAFLAPPPDRRLHAFLLLIVVFVCGLHGVTFGHSRYHLPLVPILIMYAASLVQHRARLATATPARALVGPALMASLAVLVWSRELLFRDFDHIAALVRVLRHVG